ncbi:MAG: phage tail sheath family protein [Leptolyngbya sp. SIOISBB]|nr:phage tail sheath family protein [Leptolyngbya sp. SIOISBB]
MEPTRIESLLDFQTYFGGDYRPATYEVQLDPTTNAIGTVAPSGRYYLYGCLRHFYANGGGICYIVSVGSYRDDADVEFGDIAPPTGLRGGLERLAQVDEVTLLLAPDGVLLDPSDGPPTTLGSLQAAALTQCETLQDRFVIMDLSQGNQATSVSFDPIAGFRNAIGTNSLKYGSAYYPWLQTIYRPTVHFRHLNFVDDSAVPIPVGTLNTLLSGPNADDLNALVPATRDADATVQTVITAVNIGAMIGSDALSLDRDNFAALTEHFLSLLERLRQVQPAASSDPADVATFEANVRQHFGNLLLLPRALALALPTLDANTGLPAEVNQAIASLQTDAGLRAAIVRLIELEKDPDSLAASDRAATAVDADYSTLSDTVWLAPDGDLAVADIDAVDPPLAGGTDLRLQALNAATAIQGSFDAIAAAVLSLYEAAAFLANEAETQLFANHPVMKAAAEQVQKVMSTLPCSGAVAGIYAKTDRLRGVWKAPANVSVTDVVGPVVKINDADQADLNVHPTGKSVNAIRTFAGKGTLVWGARTLAGNDNEWRYVPVRRFFNMAEESIKKSTEAFVFEPNDANTWVRVRAMIENFLTLQWRAGALAGGKPEQAFFVKVGLGETMTAQDILEGRMIVEIGMAVVRPAEFIILKFAHKMQVS